jgi:dolichol-phosphate mannosyltransferase
MTSIDIVLPVYDEEQGIEAFNASLFTVLRGLSGRYVFRVIYVVDRCRDDSFGVLARLAAGCPEVTVLQLSRRFGHQMSLVAGIDQSRGDACIMMDCDGQHPPSVIPDLLAGFEAGNDIVFTSRRYERAIGLGKRVTSHLFYVLQNRLSPMEIPPGSADFRLVSRKVVRVFQESVREQEQFLRGLFQWVGFRSTTVEFTSPARTAGATKYDLRRLLQFSVTGVLSFSRTPLRLATALGCAISIASIAWGAFLAISFFIGGPRPAGYTSLAVALFFLGGLQLFVLGVIGEYIGSIHAEVKRRPLYIIDQVVEGATAVAPSEASTA